MLKQLLFVALFHIAFAAKEYYDTEDNENLNQLFENFLVQFNKTYVGTEKTTRFTIFQDNLRKINEMNDKHEHTEFGINFFADVEASEMHRFTGFLAGEAPGEGRCQDRRDPSSRTAPAELDWRALNVVTPVKDQDHCGSCWAFSATATVESAYARQTGQIVDLSEQQLVDCDNTSDGCKGGWPHRALSKLIEVGGQQDEASYAYTHTQGRCRFDLNRVAVRVSGCASHSLSSEEYMKQVLYENGPVGVVLDATDLRLYAGGILTSCIVKYGLNHAVVLVGYGSENGIDYWIIKNSWSNNWGESGFVRIQRGVNSCGIFNPYITSATTA